NEPYSFGLFAAGSAVTSSIGGPLSGVLCMKLWQPPRNRTALRARSFFIGNIRLVCGRGMMTQATRQAHGSALAQHFVGLVRYRQCLAMVVLRQAK
ncbi:MAG: hypothetical protein CMK95_17010, partial [Pseudomonas sp.]|nr:hypothetical protein [Pseudomonas sp.]